MQGIDGRACVGLIFAISGIHGVPSSMNLGVELLSVDEWSWSLLLLGLPLLAVMMQIATGCAFAFGLRRAAWPCFGGYVAATMGLVIFFVVELAGVDGEFGLTTWPSLTPMLIESLGPPLLAAVAFAIARPTGGTIRVEAGVLLTVLGINAIAVTAIRVMEMVRILGWGSSSAIGGPISSLVVLAGFLVIGILQTRAGLALRRGTKGSDRALGAFVIASIVGELLLLAARVGSTFLDDRLEEYGGQRGMVISFHLTAAIGGIAMPLLIWAFARRDRPREVPANEPRAPMTAAWILLLSVPFLAAQPWLATDAITAVFDSEVAAVIAAVFAAQALATTVAVAGAVRQWPSAATLALVATVLGIATASVLLIMTYLEPHHRAIEASPLVKLVVAGAVLAWLHRTATGPRGSAGSGPEFGL